MNKSRMSSLLFGGLLVLLGLLWLLGNLFPQLNINLSLLWPLFLLIPGVVMWFVYLFSKERENDWGLLIPANILTF
jgi:uncharacterized membrane protein HdeD (DUF308 family)